MLKPIQHDRWERRYDFFKSPCCQLFQKRIWLLAFPSLVSCSYFFSWKKKWRQKFKANPKAPPVWPAPAQQPSLQSVSLFKFCRLFELELLIWAFQEGPIFLRVKVKDCRRCIPLPFSYSNTCLKLSRDKELNHPCFTFFIPLKVHMGFKAVWTVFLCVSVVQQLSATNFFKILYGFLIFLIL